MRILMSDLCYFKIVKGTHNGLIFASTLTNACGVVNGVYVMFDKVYYIQILRKIISYSNFIFSPMVIYFIASII